MLRDTVRAVNGLRKAAGLTRETMIELSFATENRNIIDLLSTRSNDLKKQVLANSITQVETLSGTPEQIGDGEVIFLVTVQK